VFAEVGTCLQVLLAGSKYFVFWNSFMSHPTQYCEVMVLRFLQERGYQYGLLAIAGLLEE
jgi:hypothetical protein